MSIMDDVDLLRRIPMFAKIDPAKLKLLAFTSERVTFEAGQELFHQGDSGDAAYIIVDGSTEVLLDSPQAKITLAGDNEGFVKSQFTKLLARDPGANELAAFSKALNSGTSRETLIRALVTSAEYEGY